MNSVGSQAFPSDDSNPCKYTKQQYLPNGAEYTYGLEQLLLLVTGETLPSPSHAAVINTIRVLRGETDLAKLLLYTENNVLDLPGELG